MTATNINKDRTDDDKSIFVDDEAYIETYTGKKIHFLRPTPDMFDIVDIAHALSNNCRWTGHCKRFYSVAEHSVRASQLSQYPLAALLHDASEAYLTDVAAPVKPSLTNYHKLEDGIMKAIAQRFNFVYPLPKDVKVVDTLLLSEEAYELTRNQGHGWKMWDIIGGRPERQYLKLQCWSPDLAKEFFLQRFFELTAFEQAA